MKIYETIHKNINYRFEMFESINRVEVLKGGDHIYTINKNKSKWSCSCMGSMRWGRCWHMQEGLPILLLTPACSEPWCGWAEDAAKLQKQIHG